jgi:uncharacterized membrane protein YccC
MLHITPVDSAMERVIEVLLGGLTGLFVSFVLMPWSAFQHTREVAAQALERMAKAVPGLIEGFERGLDSAEVQRTMEGIGRQLSEMSAIAAEAEHERPLRASANPMPGPLFRTVRRLRNDLVIIARAAGAPLPPTVKSHIQAALKGVGEAIGNHLQACAASLMSRQAAPSREALDGALARYNAEIEALRRAGGLRALPFDDVERVFAAGFALEQAHLNLRDLDRCVDEWAAQ